MKKYIGAALSLASVGMLFYIMFNQKDQIKNLKAETKSQKQIIDSLTNDNTIIQHENDVYEIAIDKIADEDSATAEFINEAIHNTE